MVELELLVQCWVSLAARRGCGVWHRCVLMHLKALDEFLTRQELSVRLHLKGLRYLSDIAQHSISASTVSGFDQLFLAFKMCFCSARVAYAVFMSASSLSAELWMD